MVKDDQNIVIEVIEEEVKGPIEEESGEENYKIIQQTLPQKKTDLE